MLNDAQQNATLAEQMRARESEERRRQVRGLIVLVLVVLLLSITRAHWERVFPHGWTRLWMGR